MSAELISRYVSEASRPHSGCEAEQPEYRCQQETLSPDEKERQ
jgi:hypothetical protein